MVTDTLCWKPLSMESLSYKDISQHPLARAIKSLANDFLRLKETSVRRVLEHMEIKSTFFDQI